MPGLNCAPRGAELVRGPAINYGEVSPSHRERFQAGAFNLGDGKTRYLDLGHDPEKVLAFTGGGGPAIAGHDLGAGSLRNPAENPSGG